MKDDYKEALKYYSRHFDFPKSNIKDWCDYYQNTCRFYLDEVKIEPKLTLIKKIITRLFK